MGAYKVFNIKITSAFALPFQYLFLSIQIQPRLGPTTHKFQNDQWKTQQREYFSFSWSTAESGVPFSLSFSLLQIPFVQSPSSGDTAIITATSAPPIFTYHTLGRTQGKPPPVQFLIREWRVQRTSVHCTQTSASTWLKSFPSFCLNSAWASACSHCPPSSFLPVMDCRMDEKRLLNVEMKLVSETMSL